MPTPCVTCKPGDATFHQSAVANTGCEGSYQLVDGVWTSGFEDIEDADVWLILYVDVWSVECMKRHNGRVSACVQEWELFRKCHEEGKALKAQQKTSQQ